MLDTSDKSLVLYPSHFDKLLFLKVVHRQIIELASEIKNFISSSSVQIFEYFRLDNILCPIIAEAKIINMQIEIVHIFHLYVKIVG